MRETSRQWPGAWQATDLGSAVWRFDTQAPAGPEVYALEVRRHAAHLTSRLEESLEIEWRSGSVEITRRSRLRAEQFTARGLLAHEPLPDLYAQLPLERLDRRARRFWSRVFWLVRLPGGRGVLRWLARRR